MKNQHPNVSRGFTMTCKQALVAAVLLLLPGFLRADEPRTKEEVKKKLAEINAPGEKPADAPTAEREAALRRLNAYRYLAGLDHDVVLDREMNLSAQAGAELCKKINRIDHRPVNPGLPEEEYQKGLKGTSTSNLGWGFRTMTEAVDYWMDDSDKFNVERLGHRRWCLNPTMQKVGFGRAGVFSAMSCFDRSRAKVAEHDFISWPARGVMPVEYFKPAHAWSVSLNLRKYKPAAATVKPTIQALDGDGKKVGEPLKLKYVGVDRTPFGIPNCIIFQPEKLQMTADKRYLVEIEGLATIKGKAATLRYEVTFVSLK
jgi:Cysteine-rich secretory protein family